MQLKKIYNKLPHASSKYYRPVDDKETVESFNQINPYGMNSRFRSLRKMAIIAGEQLWRTKTVRVGSLLCKAAYLDQTKRCSLCRVKKQANPDVKIMIICYNGNVRTTKSGECPVKNFRQNAHNNLMKIARGVAIIDPENNNKLLSDTLIDRDVYLPQIVKGALKDDMSYLYDFQGNKIE